MTRKDDDPSPPERDRTANRRWMIGLVVTLVFGIFGAVMAYLNYIDGNRTTTIYRNRKSPPAAPPPAAPAAPTGEAPSGEPPAEPSPSDDKGKDDKK